MLAKNFLATTLVAALLAIPAASATWYVGGSYEPDTTHDLDGYMWKDADTSPNAQSKKIYFNVIQNNYPTGQNPNVGLAGSAIRVTPMQTWHGLLGVWKDCNEDGFIGLADGAVAEYPTELLLGGGVCPAPSEFNRDGWVYEFLWIGPSDVTSNESYFIHPRAINDTSAMVWGDFGLPGEAPRGSCALRPVPAGTTSSTGGAIAYVDCIAGRKITENVNKADAILGLGLAMDPNSPQTSPSPLNQQLPVHPFYNPYGPDGQRTGFLEDTSNKGHEKNEMVHVFDCTKSGTPVTDPTGQLPQTIPDPTGGEDLELTDDNGAFFVVPAVGTPGVNPFGSLYDSVNTTEEATLDACAGDDGNGAETVNIATDLIEDYHGGVNPDAGRRSTDVYFYYDTAWVATQALDDDGYACLFTEPDFPEGCRENAPSFDGTIPSAAPQDLGVGVHRAAGTGAGLGVGWNSGVTYTRTPQSISRNTLNPEGAEYMTWYAYVGFAGASAMLPVGSALSYYGQEACGSARDGVAKQWDCNPDHWWNPKYDPATDEMPTQTGGDIPGGSRDVGARIGQPYNLRDVDCVDGEAVRGSGVYASLTPLVETCARP